MQFDPRNETIWSYDPDRRQFTACASDCGWRAGETPRTFQFHSPLTGTTVFMGNAQVDIRDGDLQSWTFQTLRVQSDDPTVDVNMQFTALIFND